MRHPHSGTGRRATRTTLIATAAAALLAGCWGGGGDDDEVATLTCDDTLMTDYKPDAQTTVVAVHAFAKDDPLILEGTATADTPRAAADVCMVKLNVGPGNDGPDGAPSTSPGIGIEIWLPAKDAWNGRVHALGGGGWQGGNAGVATAVASTGAAGVAGVEGAVSSTTDTGHMVAGTGAFAMNPDGSINETLWTDFASRGIHEQAVKSKDLAEAYYGSAPRYAYWEGGSTGGRQGLNLAQNHPDDFDGIIANYPAINWTRFITAELYPQLVYQRDLGGVALTSAQSDLVSNAAIAACDVVNGEHLGYVLDPSSCHYDPTTDASVICTADGGSNGTDACVSPAQAEVANKIWYGMTADGSVPDPADDNGWSQAASSTLMGNGNHRWFGLTRGTTFYSPYFVGLASSLREFPIGSDMVALELQDPTIASTLFVNASGNGENGWMDLSYAELSAAYDRGTALQSEFGDINTDDPDLSAFRHRGGKLLTWHGLADELIFPQGTVNYYERVAAAMGGIDSVQDFYRLFLAPGLGHGTPNGTSNPDAVVPNFASGQMYQMLTQWVEDGIAPEGETLSTTSGSVTHSLPLCAYPTKPTWVSGDVTAAASYECR